MSTYQIEKLCYRAVHEPAFREALKSDPEGTLATLPLTDEERSLLVGGEVGRLYEMGVHPYLLSHISRVQLFGVTSEVYRTRMRALLEDGYQDTPGGAGVSRRARRDAVATPVTE